MFSSALVRVGMDEEEDVIHEVYRNDEDLVGKIDRLKDVSFFKSMAKDFGYSVVEIIRQ